MSRSSAQIARRRQREEAFRSCGKYIELGADVCSRREQLGTRATLPRFPSSSSSSSWYSSPLPSRRRSTNPGSSVIPRALSGSRTCLASGDSLIRSTFSSPNPSGSACGRSEVPRDRVVANMGKIYIKICPGSVRLLSRYRIMLMIGSGGIETRFYFKNDLDHQI